MPTIVNTATAPLSSGAAAGLAQQALVLPDARGMLPPKFGGEGREFGLGHLRRRARAEAAPHRDPAREIGEHLAPVNEVPVMLEQRPEGRRVAAET